MQPNTQSETLIWKPSSLHRDSLPMTESVAPRLYRKVARYYDFLMRLLGYVQTRAEILRTFLPALPRGATILEIGCGTGVCTAVLKASYPDAEIRAFDQCPEMLARFRERHPTVPVVEGDFNHPGLLDSHPHLREGSYDFVLSAAALSEYGGSEAYSFVAGLLKERGIFLNIGIRQNVLGWLIGAAWGFRPCGVSSIVQKCEAVGLAEITCHRPSWRCFPRTLIDVIVRAEKSPASRSAAGERTPLPDDFAW
jgi:SAM-dependent methyltransferase